MMKRLGVIMLPFAVFMLSCTTNQEVVRVESQVIESQPEEKVLKRKVAIARFSNETQYAKGIFYDKDNDPLGKQASDILSTKLAVSNKFILLERQDMDKIIAEMEIGDSESFQQVSADYIIIGSVTEFGRKNVGDVNMFSRSKTQKVQAGVSLRLIDVSTGQVIYSEEAKGESEETAKTVMGLGEEADYDATLSDKAISAAISKLVENIINNCMDREWRAYFLSYDEDGIIISGGESQGIEVGSLFDVIKKGKKVKNPQTGMYVELPGEKVAKIKIDFTGGNTTSNEFSMVSIIEGKVEKTNLSDYYITEE
ncbi:MAG: penicillin-binding protein activator LpoB [Bacteroidales bacterium]|nr:penicillin-binding protein activator LpoB [Bacteroidales bacterium]